MAISQYLTSIGDSLKDVAQHLDPSRVLDKMKAYGDFSRVDGSYFCNPAKINGLEKITYSDEVRSFSASMDAYIKHEGKSVAGLSDSAVNPTNLDLLDKTAKCLAENGVDPDSVAQFSDSAKEVLSYNMERLYMVAPNLTEHADVPFTGDAIMSLMLSGSVLGAMYGISKLRGRFGDVFWK